MTPEPKRDRGSLAPRKARTLHLTRVLALCTVVAVIAVPRVARLVDRTADSIASHTSPFWLAASWTITGLLFAAVVVHVLRRAMKLPSGGGFALAYDSLPFSLMLAWLVFAGALITRHRLLATTAGLLCLYHVALMAPRARSARRPRWVRHAPVLRIGSANVFVDNPTPERSAAGLLAVDIDVLIINESTPAFLQAFERVGGHQVFPYCLTDPADDSTYAISVFSRHPFLPGTGFSSIGTSRVARLPLMVNGTPVSLVAVHLYASLETNGYEIWAEQMHDLRRYLLGAPSRELIVGDFNTTHFRPEFLELLSTGVRDAHDTLGRGWSRSIKISATGLLSSLGPIARLDHALLTDGVWPLQVRNLPARGSDHLPFVLSVAIRPDGCAGTTETTSYAVRPEHDRCLGDPSNA